MSPNSGLGSPQRHRVHRENSLRPRLSDPNLNLHPNLSHIRIHNLSPALNPNPHLNGFLSLCPRCVRGESSADRRFVSGVVHFPSPSARLPRASRATRCAAPFQRFEIGDMNRRVGREIGRLFAGHDQGPRCSHAGCSDTCRSDVRSSIRPAVERRVSWPTST